MKTCPKCDGEELFKHDTAIIKPGSFMCAISFECADCGYEWIEREKENPPPDTGSEGGSP